MEALHTVQNWLASHWGWLVVIVIPLVSKALNKVTQHYSERKGLVRFCLFVIDLLDIIKLSPAPGTVVPIKGNGGSVQPPTEPPK